MNSWCRDLELLIKSRTSIIWIRTKEEERLEKLVKSSCEKLNIKCIRVELDPELQYINGYQQFEGDSYVNGGSHACAYSYSWGWKHYVSKDDGISMIIDSDMFFIKDVSIEKLLGDHNLAYIPSYRYSSKYHSEEDRGSIALRYPWNGIVIADIPNLPNPNDLKWGLGIFNGEACDVGGEGHRYLIDYKDQLKIKYIDQRIGKA